MISFLGDMFFFGGEVYKYALVLQRHCEKVSNGLPKLSSKLRSMRGWYLLLVSGERKIQMFTIGLYKQTYYLARHHGDTNVELGQLLAKLWNYHFSARSNLLWIWIYSTMIHPPPSNSTKWIFVPNRSG